MTEPQPPAPAEDAPMKGVRNIIAVGAGKGGVGKSAVAVHLAVGLQRAGAEVGLLDCDVYGPSIAKMLGIEGLAPQPAEANRIAPFHAHGMKVMTMANLVPAGRAMIWRGPMVHGVIRQFLVDVDWGELGYLVADLPPGTGDVPLTLAQTVGVAGAVIVTTPQAVALEDALRAAEMYEKLGIRVLGVVENMSYFVCPACGAEHDVFGRGGARKAAEAAGLAFLGEIPLDLDFRRNTDAARPEANFGEQQPGALATAIAEVVGRTEAAVRLRNETHPPARPLEVKGGPS